MSREVNLNVVIKAEDKLSPSIKSAQKTVESLEKTVNSASTAVKSSTTASTSATSGWKNLAKGVAVGTAAYDLARRAIGEVTSFFKESVAEAFNQQQAYSQLNAVLISTKGAAGVTAEAAIKLSESFAKTTTYTDDAVLGAENLLLTFTKIGKDKFPQATQAVLDMSTALGQDLKSSAIQLGKALQDPILGVSALRRVGVNFNETDKETIKGLVETGHQMEAQTMILKELNTEFGGSAAAAAETYQGKLTNINKAFGEVKEGIGFAILQGVKPLIDWLSKLALGTYSSTSWIEKLARAIYSGIYVFKAIGIYIYSVIKILAAFGMTIVDVAKIVYSFAKDVINNFFNLGKTVETVFKAIGQALTGDFSGAKATFVGLVKGMVQNTTAEFANFSRNQDATWNSVQDTMESAGVAINEAINQTGFQKLGFTSEAAAKSVETGMNGVMDNTAKTSKKSKKDLEDLAKAVVDMGDKYNDFAKEGKSALIDLEATHKEKLKGLVNDVADTEKKIVDLKKETNKQISDLNNSFATNDADNLKSVASVVVETEQKIADLRKQISDEQDSTKKSELEAQLVKEQASLTKNADFIKGISTQVQQAREYAAMSDLDKAIFDYNARRAIAVQELSDKTNDLNAELAVKLTALNTDLANQKAKVDEENALYKSKTDYITKLMTDTATQNAAIMDADFNVTKDYIDKEIKLYDDLKKAITDAKSAQALSVISGIQTPTISSPISQKGGTAIKKLASGGIVTSPTMALIGESGPEAVVPLTKNSGIGGITVNINGGTYLSHDVAEKIGDMIFDRLKLQQRI